MFGLDEFMSFLYSTVQFGLICDFYFNNQTKPQHKRPNTQYVSYFDVMQHANGKISNLYIICTLILF